MSQTFEGICALSIALIAFTGAELVGGNGFIAAFVGSFYNDSVTPVVLGFGVLMLPIIYITWHDQRVSIKLGVNSEPRFGEK